MAELVNVAELVSTIADLRAEVQNLKGMSSPNQTRASAPRGIGTQPSAELIQPSSSMSSPHSPNQRPPRMPENHSSLGILPTALRGTGSLGHSGYSTGQPPTAVAIAPSSTDSIHPT